MNPDCLCPFKDLKRGHCPIHGNDHTSQLKMLRLDGEIWRIGERHDTDENSVSCRPAVAGRDDKAIAAGVTHIQTMYGGSAYHEIERLG